MIDAFPIRARAGATDPFWICASSQRSQAADLDRGDLGAAFEGALMRRSAEGDENLFLVWLHWKEVSKRVDRGRDALELSLLEQVRS